ncbi:hypothetical protein IGI04_023216 [Brassica rapa subsp. trilocularis]|uniref:Uncharacterized protein n=1 Tax=Brassica rapa subsp. trilocularis TaxID=1813537 RepID=A0ABQ7M5D2_BRACM|nr:hypothetical protein IGI04_023216 [Brassica rapa subsp. trilocularis]
MHTATLHTEEYDEDYEKERAINYRAILAEEDKLLHHSSWKWNTTSIDKTVPISIDICLRHTSCRRASTDSAYYPSIDTGVDHAREGDYSIGSWADAHYHESFAVEIAISQPHAEELHKGFTPEKLLNMQERDEEEKDEYGVYKDDHGHAKDVGGHIIRVSKDDIRCLLERASIDEHSYLCLPGHARSFTQTKLVPEIYAKDEINEMFYGEMRQDIAMIQTQRATEATTPTSIDKHLSTSIDDDLKHSNTMKSQPHSYTRAEIDHLIEAIQMELVEIQRYIARRPEASTSIDRHNNISTDNHRHASIDGATNRGRLVPKMTSDMSDTNNHGQEISDDAYATLLRNEFQLEKCLKEPKLTSNLIELNSACLGAWYTWDQILQPSLPSSFGDYPSPRQEPCRTLGQENDEQDCVP